MTRLAFQIDQNGADYRAAASRIADVQIVGIDDNPDAVVASAVTDTHKPTLLVGVAPSAAHHFPAMTWRFCPHVAAIRASLDAEQLGEPGLLRMHRWAPRSGEPGDLARVAAVELALWLIGEPPDSSHATRNSKTDLIHLGFPSGAMAMLDFTESLRDGEGYRSLCLVGSRGTAYADDHRDRQLLFGGGAPVATPPDSGNAALQPMLEDFVVSVRDGRTGEAATRALTTARQLVRSVLP